LNGKIIKVMLIMTLYETYESLMPKVLMKVKDLHVTLKSIVIFNEMDVVKNAIHEAKVERVK
jgi:hypothetical protein